jgi:hypothetical protein
LDEKENGMKIWCEDGVKMKGGSKSDGGSIVGESVLYKKSRKEGEEKGEGEMKEKKN